MKGGGRGLGQKGRGRTPKGQGRKNTKERRGKHRERSDGNGEGSTQDWQGQGYPRPKEQIILSELCPGACFLGELVGNMEKEEFGYFACITRTTVSQQECRKATARIVHQHV